MKTNKKYQKRKDKQSEEVQTFPHACYYENDIISSFESEKVRNFEREEVLLSDEQVQQFLIDGYLVIEPSQHLDSNLFHSYIYKKAKEILESEGNPGNNILPKIPQLQEVYDDPCVRGALKSLLGNQYTMQAHRFCHLSVPGNQQQQWHKDSFFGYSRPLRHNQVRYIMAMYYPQQITIKNGPTGFKIGGTHYYCIDPKRYRGELDNEFKKDDTKVDRVGICKAGSIILIHYDIVHRATRNNSDQDRFMFKFQFNRLEEPIAPTWNCKSKDWDAKSAGNLLRPIVYHVWNWLCGQAGKALPIENVETTDHVKSLHSMKEDERFFAAYSLSLSGDFKPLINLINFSKNIDEQLRFNAAYALTSCSKVSELVSNLMSILNSSESQNVRITSQAIAAFILMEIGPRAIQSVPCLIKNSKSKNSRTRFYVAEALGTVCSRRSAEESLSLGIDELRNKGMKCLLSMLENEKEDQVRFTLPLALARIATSNDLIMEEAVPKLSILLHYDLNRYVRANALLALETIGTKEAMKHVMYHYRCSRLCSITTTSNPF